MTIAVVGARHPMFATLALRNGVREDLVADRHRWITSEENRAVIGPVRHRRRFGWRKRGQVAADIANERVVTMADMGDQLARIAITMRQAGESIRMAYPTPPPPQDTRSRYRKVADWWLERFYSEEWHKGIRHTAADVLLWGFVIAAVITMGRGLLWVLSV